MMNTSESAFKRNRLLKVAVMGQWGSGKTSIINALAHIPQLGLSETKHMTFIKSGKDESIIEIHTKDRSSDNGTSLSSKCFTMSIDEYIEKYKITEKDEVEFIKTGTVKRFDEIEYAVRYSSKPFLGGNVVFIDCPFPDARKTSISHAIEIIKQSDAFIYCCSERGVCRDDRALIPQFTQYNDNVFILINKTDLVPDDEETLFLKHIKISLKEVFTDEKGRFDEQLYAKRVFPVSALFAIAGQNGDNSLLRRDANLSDEECKNLLEKSGFNLIEKVLYDIANKRKIINDMGYSKEKQQTLANALTNIGCLAGTNTSGIAGGIKGLEISTEQAKCEQEASLVRSGLFKVAIMGSFSCGKSTIINALVGAKILPDSALPCTAILTYIQYGKDENTVKVFMEDKLTDDGKVISGACQEMGIKEFREKYKYTDHDEVEFKETGTVRRFAEIKYAIMYCSKSLMEDGITIIDSPGLEDKKIATDLSLKIAKEAQAIIYCVSERGLTKPDREYINSHFRNCPNNVFFLINKIDLVVENEVPNLLHKIKLDLKEVFTDENGYYDEELYAHRVFPVSALWAIDAHTGMTYDRLFRRDRKLTDEERRIMLEGSQYTPFEKELETFLTTDEKCLAQYHKCFEQMASTYKNATLHVSSLIAGIENNLIKNNDEKDKCNQLIDDIRKSIKITEATFDNCSLKIQNKVSEVLSGCATDIDKSWNQDLVEISKKIDVGTFEYMFNGLRQINPFSSKDAKKEAMEKFTGKFISAVTEYFADKVVNYIEDNRVAIDEVVEECQKQLNISLDNTDRLFEDLSGQLTNVATKVNTTEKSWLQILISSYLGDFSAVTKGAIDGKSNWTVYLKKTLLNTVWQVILISFIDGGLGILLTLLIEFFQGKANQKESVKMILEKSKEGVVRNIQEQTQIFRKQINTEIAVKIDQEKKKTTGNLLSQLYDEENTMNTIIAAHKDINFNLEEAKRHYNAVLNAIYDEAKSSYSIVCGQHLSLAAFKKL